MMQLIIMRGLPGSGKSHEARVIAEEREATSPGRVVILSTDDFFTMVGHYFFDVTMLGMAHAWNQWRCRQAMLKAEFCVIIIDNTNTRRWEMEPYFMLARQFGWHVSVRMGLAPWADDPVLCAAHCTKDISAEKIQEMKDRFEA